MNFIDQLSIYAIFLICLVTQIVSIEAGFRMGKLRKGKPNKSQMAQVRAIMGASLGLLAFMLAFSFNAAQQHFEARTGAYMLEVSAIDSAFRGSDLIMEEERGPAKDLLRNFAQLRIETSRVAKDNDIERVVDMIRESERIHDQLWSLAERSMEGAGDGQDTAIFAQAVLAMIDAHDARIQYSFFNRIPPIIWLTLFGMAVASMAVMGYQAGLTGTRSSFATWTLALTFAFVMTLITDLDRPRMTFFKLNQDLMIELHSRMDGGDFWDPEAHRNIP
jgi:hypothetical protein